ncbi:MAG: dihydrodipicolinate synthase family protein [Chloroflexi bacterium]|nr:dihydrodipicolinate synthase family protein [Chloroflexota bacterium]
MPDRSMTGVYPILSIPFDVNGKIVWDDFERLIEWTVGHGVHGVGVAMASEIYKLTESERDEVTRFVVKHVRGRAKVVINTGAEGTDVAIHYSKSAQGLGADALMIRPPTYVPSGGDENVEYFRRIAEAVNIPIFLQDQSTAQVPPALAVRCARTHPNLCYVKVESPPTSPRVAESVKLRGDSGLIIFGGAGGAFFIEELRRGAVGTMPGNTLPDMFVQVWNLWQSGKQDAAEREFHKHQALIRTLGQGLGLANWVYKDVLVERGVIKASSAYARHPSLKPDDDQRREVVQLLEELGLRATAGARR